jgi:predicted AlkP superfamily phosphohydrolase/phosphomutase
MIIGFDGATFDLVRPWADAGLLPTFQRLMQHGAWGDLESTAPPLTPVAWSSMATGLGPGKHGVFDFFARRPGSYDTYLVNSTHRHGTPLWSLAGEQGCRATVINVPATYPPEQVNGLMVTGLLTPNDAGDASWPRGLLAELKQAVPDFGFYPPGVFSPGQEAGFVQSVLEWDRMTLRATHFLMDRQPWDFLFTVFVGIDIVSHFMWRYMAAASHDGRTSRTEPSRPPDLAADAVLADAIQSVYRQADDILAQMLQAAGDDTYVFVVSDHGFGPLDYYMHLNAWLVKRGYLKFKRTPLTQLKALAYRLGLTPLSLLTLARRLRLGGRVQKTASRHHGWIESLARQAFLSLPDVDWSRTTAYASGFGGPIFLNLRGRQPAGIVEPGAEAEALLQRLTDDLKALRHPVTGEPFVGAIYRPEDLYSGPYAQMAPDLLFEPKDWSNQGFGLHDFASNRWLEPSPDRTGTHRMNGILLMQGPGVLPGCRLEKASLLDVAPTALALMGVPIPKNADGRVLVSAFDETLRSQLAITYREEDGTAAGQAQLAVMSEQEEQDIRERLSALGYVG